MLIYQVVINSNIFLYFFIPLYFFVCFFIFFMVKYGRSYLFKFHFFYKVFAYSKYNKSNNRTDEAASGAQGLLFEIGVIRKHPCLFFSLLLNNIENTKEARTSLSEPLCSPIKTQKRYNVNSILRNSLAICIIPIFIFRISSSLKLDAFPPGLRSRIRFAYHRRFCFNTSKYM